MSDQQGSRALALELLGRFARLQEMIDGVGQMFFEKKMPELERFLRQKALRRMTDEERIMLLKSLLNELEVDHSPRLKATFNAVKKVRDAIAHSSVLQVAEDRSLILQNLFLFHTKKETQAPTLISRDELLKMLHYCSWLETHIFYMVQQANLIKAMYQGSIKISCIRPDDDPDKWDGEQWKPVNPEESLPPRKS